MKMRCTSGSIRFRLIKPDLSALLNNHFVQEVIHFGENTSITYRLQLVDDSNHLQAHFADSVICIDIPRELGLRWANSDEVGISNHSSPSKSHMPDILIEKDFPCVDREEENHGDTFWELADKEGKNC